MEKKVYMLLRTLVASRENCDELGVLQTPVEKEFDYSFVDSILFDHFEPFPYLSFNSFLGN